VYPTYVLGYVHIRTWAYIHKYVHMY